jgi:hypothetical protein
MDRSARIRIASLLTVGLVAGALLFLYPSSPLGAGTVGHGFGLILIAAYIISILNLQIILFGWRSRQGRSMLVIATIAVSFVVLFLVLVIIKGKI